MLARLAARFRFHADTRWHVAIGDVAEPDTLADLACTWRPILMSNLITANPATQAPTCLTCVIAQQSLKRLYA